MEAGFLQALVLAFLAASVIAALMHRLKQPPVMAYLLVGLLIGPSGVGLIRDVHNVQALAEVGVIVLMFSLGVEFSMAQLKRLWRPALIGGSIQLWVTIFGVFLLWGFLYGNGFKGLFAGCILAMSSTVIVLKLLEDGGGTHTPHGAAALGMAIYQDVMVVPLMLLLSALGGKESGALMGLMISLGKSVLFLGVCWLINRLAVRWFFDVVARTRSKELFTISAVAMCLGVALLAERMGLSVAVGAFVAGLLVSRSIYSHKIFSDMLPLRDCFLSLFFISVGMLVNVDWAVEHWQAVLGWGCLGVFFKFVVALGACLACGFPLQASLLAGMALSQVGEFSFVLLLQGIRDNDISQEDYQLFLGVILFTLVVVPALWRPFGRWARWLVRRPFVRRWEDRRYAQEEPEHAATLKDHVVLVGCGPFGQTVLHSLQVCRVHCRILELNSETVRSLQQAGFDAMYGEAGNLTIMESLHLESACAMVVTIPDVSAAAELIREARMRRPDLLIIGRARYGSQIEKLRKAGANHVVYEEMEAATKAARLLESLLKEGAAQAPCFKNTTACG
ncbi:MAG: cation:proton antiporter [Verrucomicrobiae bacterium]|nr:cation:proton antiporter [Verrucomicrobiae bacterium]